MRKKRAPRKWAIKLSQGFLDVEAIVENDNSGCEIAILPGEDLHSSAGTLLHATFATAANVAGTLDADGEIIIKLNAFEKEET